jgi:hypothetical protein
MMFTLLVEAKLLRSAGLYYSPESQIEITSLASYGTKTYTHPVYLTNSTLGTFGARVEHGFHDSFSWGSVVAYGVGSNVMKSVASENREEFEGMFDPEFFLKSHLETESMRFHANGIFALKGEAKMVGQDRVPVNFSNGGSSFALLLGMEGAVGPTLLGTHLRGDLWKDEQEVIEKNLRQVETIYFRQGGKSITGSVFGELNNLKYIKPGIRLQAGQTESSKTEIQSNQSRLSLTVPYYEIPQELQLSASIYGRVRLPAHFVLNFELMTLDRVTETSASSKHNQDYELSTSIGYKF